MKTQLLFDESYLTIEYNSKNNCLYAKWKENQTMESLKLGYSKMYELLTQKKCKRILNDTQLIDNNWLVASHWDGQIWVPQMINAGLKTFAWVYNQEFYSNHYKYKAHTKNSQPNIYSFGNFNEAEEWLEMVA